MLVRSTSERPITVLDVAVVGGGRDPLGSWLWLRSLLASMTEFTQQGYGLDVANESTINEQIDELNKSH